ncbi:Lar family restriction alleviation protein [Pseudomonas fulva]|uniref:Lar family restriction alleviation protein n=1 Tax=Pseudomonas fulva TaxID=47880 RepID=UPI001E323CD4|nr:Lar family restriction alleviation protein [Pseudomonas fulva]
MPTENRSSNTEMAAQLSPCPFCGQQDAFVEQLDSDASVVICQGRIDEYSVCLARGPVGVQQHECEDQPGYDQAVKEWNKRAAAAPHPAPIAWMVDTAFWWTKEEAERDAAATGLPIVGLGPMTNAAEVERLRNEHTEAINVGMRYQDQARALRAQLAERDALLDRVVDHANFWHDHPYAEVVEGIARDYKALSASAEPSAQTWACQSCQLEQPTDRPCDVCGGKTEPVATKP